MKKGLILLVTFFSVISIYSHNEFYKVENYVEILTYTPPYNHWQFSEVPLALQFTIYTIPSSLDYTETVNEFRNGYNVWESSSCYNFIEIMAGVECAFSSNSLIFPDPFKDGGATVRAIEKKSGVNYIVESTYYPETSVSESKVAFNNSGFINFTWTNNIVFPPPTNWIYFKSVVCHELGHLLVDQYWKGFT